VSRPHPHRDAGREAATLFQTTTSRPKAVSFRSSTIALGKRCLRLVINPLQPRVNLARVLKIIASSRFQLSASTTCQALGKAALAGIVPVKGTQHARPPKRRVLRSGWLDVRPDQSGRRYRDAAACADLPRRARPPVHPATDPLFGLRAAEARKSRLRYST
jgi:hypothetical protein